MLYIGIRKLIKALAATEQYGKNYYENFELHC